VKFLWKCKLMLTYFHGSWKVPDTVATFTVFMLLIYHLILFHCIILVRIKPLKVPSTMLSE